MLANDAPTKDATGDPASSVAPCDHCGLPCAEKTVRTGTATFCCLGCRTVYEILAGRGLDRYYELEQAPGVCMVDRRQVDYGYLDDPELRSKLLDFESETACRITLSLPDIHCVACVWLLENLFELADGIGESRVHFTRRELTVTWDPRRLTLAELVDLLGSIGYHPDLHLDAVDRPRNDRAGRRLVLQIGVAGFALGNIMLAAVPAYLGLEIGHGFARLFGWVSLLLALPVVTFSASDYWRTAWLGVRRRALTIEFPIALGLAALFGESAWQIVTGTGEGYLDSLAALVFFLLCGRWFQRRTYDRLAFDRDYAAYFPLAITRVDETGEAVVPVSTIQIGDRLRIRHGELVPADARLVRGRGAIDYSFVTGESLPVAREPGEQLYAGGRQTGSAIEVEVEAEVSESYLTSLWSDEALRRDRDSATIDDLTNRVSRWFTAIVVTVATAAGLGWAFVDPAVSVRVFVAVLIVACPCAFALAAPFALGTGLRVLGRRGLHLRDSNVLERMAGLTALVFDKTGTLTRPAGIHAVWTGEPIPARHRDALAVLTASSTHPASRAVRTALGLVGAAEIESFHEEIGRGLVGRADGVDVVCGSASWLAEHGLEVPSSESEGGEVLVATNGTMRGRFELASEYREGLAPMFRRLQAGYRATLTSGDTNRERDRVAAIMGPDATLAFGQSPHDKLALVRSLQGAGARVAMLGDGLNDAGALGQSEVGIAVSDDMSAFSPASDAILDAAQLTAMPDYLDYSRRVMRLVALCFAVSFAYNVVGVSLAASGQLSPLVSAILMPISSATVVGLAALGARHLGRKSLGPVEAVPNAGIEMGDAA